MCHINFCGELVIERRPYSQKLITQLHRLLPIDRCGVYLEQTDSKNQSVLICDIHVDIPEKDVDRFIELLDYLWPFIRYGRYSTFSIVDTSRDGSGEMVGPTSVTRSMRATEQYVSSLSAVEVRALALDFMSGIFSPHLQENTLTESERLLVEPFRFHRRQ